MENQTTAPEVQSEQPKEVAQEQVAEQQTEAKPTVLADATTEQKAEEPKVLNFKEMIPEEYKDEKSLQNFTTMNDFVKSYLSAQRLVGANKVAIPNKMATDEDWEEVFNKLGRPTKPEDYKYSFKEDEINQDQLKTFNETAYRIGLLPKQAERIIKFYNEMNTQQTADNQKVFEEKQAAAEVELKKEFGPTFNKRLDQAKKLAVETLGNDMLNNTIMKDGSRLGDNVEVIKAFSMLADKLSEDEIIKGEASYTTAKEIEKEIAELTEDGSPYWNKTHPNHKKTVDQVFKLREQLNG
jgi:hypothetical protein|tara:strand:+ start:126 stop:1013 length:888 start_codon:yes stop_codon:yes gene_type:complete